MSNSSGISKGLWAAALALFLCSSCYQKEEGCLDLRAVNFDVTADIPCSDCCTYPALSIKPEHRVILPDTTLVFRYDSLYSVSAFPDVKFRVHQLRYYLSGFRLLRTGGKGEVTDSITLYLPQGPGDTLSVRVVDDFVLADRNFLQAVQLGAWNGDGLFDRLEFLIGLSPDIRLADPGRLPAGHQLAAPAGGVNWEEGTGYISNYFMYSLEDQPQDTIRVPMTTAVPVSVGLNPPLDLKPGFNIRLSLYFNYLAWWEGLDLSAATPAQIEQQYAAQAANALFSVEVQQ